MSLLSRPARAALVAGTAGLALVATGCGSSEPSTPAAGGGASTSAECAPFEQFGKHDGKKVSIYSPIRDTEADLFQQTWVPFEKCTGMKISYEGTGEFEAQIQVRADGGNPPDLAFFPQPGLLERFVKAGKLKPASAEVKKLAEQNWSADWVKYGTIDGTFYAAPLGASVKSFVWYSPGMFKEKGWAVPTTWDELMTLTNTIAGTGIKPWCAGIESGEATGWPATDWIEDILLRELGPEGYDDWVAHKIPFNDPKIVAAVDKVGAILKDEKFVNGGYGPVKSIASTAFQEGGVPITEGKCALHRQASFYANFWPEGTKVAEDGDVFAFYLPGNDPAKKPVLGAGEFVGAFADRPEVQAVQAYLATGDYANARMKLGTYVSANKGVDIANAQNPIDKLSIEMLQDPNTVFRFDGSDLMPAAVGAGTFWKGMTDWINGKDTKTVLDFIEASWPKS
ncbi:alpha-glucoside ABC transporter substrate-binding protein [Planomonospora parontospora subsp. parontospora]|uniref:Alpha-glucoside ABC transporter substrate-binding protein n=2 Tax=Planomonospora parontospora TaxID=58119 RepID=A0AA37F4A6_9ACTN|nr:ABC transporter substrate-binding protein [Planomonospora parontospora]GGK64470.1 alpha-glucoside ABC transporter substrate-binding protein [Planomonospora parontospora]GII08079.1 alpha-glucoside ABC transporter substrate-binding protein [Planomonospora parontospora subsp. parontospora]